MSKSEAKMNRWFRDMPDRFKTRDLCEKVVRQEVEMFFYTPNDLRSQEMCDYVIMEGKGHWLFFDINDEFKNIEMCRYVVRENCEMVIFVPDRFKTREMCNNAVFEDKSLIKNVSDWFVTAEMLEKCKDKEWLEGFRRCKAQMAKIEEKLLPIAWHPDRTIDWCFSEDKKQDLEKLWEPCHS